MRAGKFPLYHAPSAPMEAIDNNGFPSPRQQQNGAAFTTWFIPFVNRHLQPADSSPLHFVRPFSPYRRPIL